MSESSEVVARYLGISPESPDQAVLRLLIELSARVVDAREGSLLVLDRTQDPPTELVFAMTVGSETSERALVGQRVPVGEGLTGLAALTHEVQIGAPFYSGVRYAKEGVVPEGEPSAVIAAPMLAGGDLVGVITAVRFDRDAQFSRNEAELYARAASVAGVVVDQRQQIDALESLMSGSASARDPVEAELLDAVSRLIRHNRGRLGDVARLIDALERLTGADSD